MRWKILVGHAIVRECGIKGGKAGQAKKDANMYVTFRGLSSFSVRVLNRAGRLSKKIIDF